MNFFPIWLTNLVRIKSSCFFFVCVYFLFIYFVCISSSLLLLDFIDLFMYSFIIHLFIYIFPTTQQWLSERANSYVYVSLYVSVYVCVCVCMCFSVCVFFNYHDLFSTPNFNISLNIRSYNWRNISFLKLAFFCI